MIKLVGVEKTFGRQPVLRGVDLTIPPGKLTTIIGGSGSGKSVLLKHIIGLLQPDRGQVLIDGTDIARLKGHALNEVRKKFAMLFKTPYCSTRCPCSTMSPFLYGKSCVSTATA